MSLHSEGKTDRPGKAMLIASEALIAAWSIHAPHASRLIAMSDRDLPRAVDMIRERAPDDVIVEQVLASSARGAPLMTSLYEERKRRGIQIRLLSPERVAALLSSHPGQTDPHVWLTAFAYPLPPRPRQRAARLHLAGKNQVLVDGGAATLVDVSALGAQVFSVRVMRPGQVVRLVLDSVGAVHPLSGTVVWSVLDHLVEGEPRYRAGIAFTDTTRLRSFTGQMS